MKKTNLTLLLGMAFLTSVSAQADVPATKTVEEKPAAQCNLKFEDASCVEVAKACLETNNPESCHELISKQCMTAESLQACKNDLGQTEAKEATEVEVKEINIESTESTTEATEVKSEEVKPEEAKKEAAKTE